ncbi:hypothetical protein [Sphingomonas rubra]|uniref:hypothetical protein n=1 Tax=Sphingomonas rubra TaxID=634430 RepID=UPI001C43672A|nr:hypothetical protein [Sphingomonas rubra]
MRLTYTLQCTYTPDFVDHANQTIYETKGRLDAADRRKMLAVKRQYPDWRIVMVLQRPNLLVAKSKTTYAACCEKNGIEWQHFKC